MKRGNDQIDGENLQKEECISPAKQTKEDRDCNVYNGVCFRKEYAHEGGSVVSEHCIAPTKHRTSEGAGYENINCCLIPAIQRNQSNYFTLFEPARPCPSLSKQRKLQDEYFEYNIERTDIHISPQGNSVEMKIKADTKDEENEACYCTQINGQNEVDYAIKNVAVDDDAASSKFQDTETCNRFDRMETYNTAKVENCDEILVLGDMTDEKLSNGQIKFKDKKDKEIPFGNDRRTKPGSSSQNESVNEVFGDDLRNETRNTQVVAEIDVIVDEQRNETEINVQVVTENEVVGEEQRNETIKIQVVAKNDVVGDDSRKAIINNKAVAENDVGGDEMRDEFINTQVVAEYDVVGDDPRKETINTEAVAENDLVRDVPKNEIFSTQVVAGNDVVGDDPRNEIIDNEIVAENDLFEDVPRNQSINTQVVSENDVIRDVPSNEIFNTQVVAGNDVVGDDQRNETVNTEVVAENDVVADDPRNETINTEVDAENDLVDNNPRNKTINTEVDAENENDVVGDDLKNETTNTEVVAENNVVEDVPRNKSINNQDFAETYVVGEEPRNEIAIIAQETEVVQEEPRNETIENTVVDENELLGDASKDGSAIDVLVITENEAVADEPKNVIITQVITENEETKNETVTTTQSVAKDRLFGDETRNTAGINAYMFRHNEGVVVMKEENTNKTENKNGGHHTQKVKDENTQKEGPNSLLVFFDLETTSLDVRRAEICQIAAICGKDTFASYVTPSGPIPSDASSINNLTFDGMHLYYRDQIVQSYGLTEVLDKFFVYLRSLKAQGEVTLVAHNARYDSHILYNHLANSYLWDEFKELVTGIADTVPVFKDKYRLWGYGECRLGHLVSRFLPQESFQAHNAVEDTRILQKLFVEKGDITLLKKYTKKCEWYSSTFPI